jgi:4-methylaminobutanoate oxidase (formaldehyde-forming)
VGEVPELRHYWVAAGLNSIGILTGGGVGQMLAYQMIHGRADADVTGYLPGRLQPYQATPAYRRARVVESLGKVGTCYPLPPCA